MPTLPPRNPTQASLLKEIEDLKREIALLKHRPEKDDVPGQHSREVVFSYHGRLLANDTSGKYLLKDFSATIHRLDITAQVAGSTDSTFEVLVDGAAAYSGTYPAGTTHLLLNDLAIEVEEFSTLSVRWPTVATNISTVVMTFQITAVDEEEYT